MRKYSLSTLFIVLAGFGSLLAQTYYEPVLSDSSRTYKGNEIFEDGLDTTNVYYWATRWHKDKNSLIQVVKYDTRTLEEVVNASIPAEKFEKEKPSVAYSQVVGNGVLVILKVYDPGDRTLALLGVRVDQSGEVSQQKLLAKYNNYGEVQGLDRLRIKRSEDREKLGVAVVLTNKKDDLPVELLVIDANLNLVWKGSFNPEEESSHLEMSDLLVTAAGDMVVAMDWTVNTTAEKARSPIATKDNKDRNTVLYRFRHQTREIDRISFLADTKRVPEVLLSGKDELLNIYGYTSSEENIGYLDHVFYQQINLADLTSAKVQIYEFPEDIIVELREHDGAPRDKETKGRWLIKSAEPTADGGILIIGHKERIFYGNPGTNYHNAEILAIKIDSQDQFQWAGLVPKHQVEISGNTFGGYLFLQDHLGFHFLYMDHKKNKDYLAGASTSTKLELIPSASTRLFITSFTHSGERRSSMHSLHGLNFATPTAKPDPLENGVIIVNGFQTVGSGFRYRALYKIRLKTDQ